MDDFEVWLYQGHTFFVFRKELAAVVCCYCCILENKKTFGMQKSEKGTLKYHLVCIDKFVKWSAK